MPHLTRTIGFALRIVCIAAATHPATATAQSAWKPERPVEIIAGTATGSAPDRMARIIQEIVRGKPQITVATTVINKPGAGGAKGWLYLNQYPGDAHYLMLAAGNLSVGYLTGTSSIGYREVTPIALLAHEYIALSVKADSPIRDGRDLLERLKKDPGALSIGVSSVAGSMTHLGAAMVLKAAGVDLKKMRTVVFPSAGKSMTAVLGGHVDIAAGSMSISLTHMRNGNTRIVGYTAPERLGGELAKIPTWREQGIPVELSNYRGMMGPRELKPAQVAYWESVFREVDRDERWRADLAKNHLERDYKNGTETAKYWDGLAVPIRTILGELNLLKL